MKTVQSFEEVRDLTIGVVGLVPTMGYLHEGHINLIEAAADRCDTVVVSVFVNPLQFGNQPDLEAYPSDLARDEDLARLAGADVLFAPQPGEMYDDPPRVTVKVVGVGDAMEGAHRPGHFVGVATVVAKLFSGIQPHTAFFGRKDAQQLALVSTMAAGLSMPIEVVGSPTVRESDGLALSSRNTRLSSSARHDAPMLSAALFAARDQFSAGERDVSALTTTVRRHVAGVASISIEYVEAADTSSARVLERIDGPSFLALAADIGGVRLIDNVFLDGRDGTSDVGVQIKERSILYGGESCS